MLDKISDTKLRGVIDALEGLNAIQRSGQVEEMGSGQVEEMGP